MDAFIEQALGRPLSAPVRGALERSLVTPASDLLGRPRKNFRGELVEIGFLIAHRSETEENWALRRAIGKEMIECLHGGSLIIDDIEDDSLFRRGESALHRKYGVPVALNTGNWLYFWPLERLSSLALPLALEREVNRAYISTLLKAHAGQALDVGTAIDRVPKEDVPSLCESSLELKSGALTAFALQLGALLAEAEPSAMAALVRFGTRLGTVLQIFDDLGNLSGTLDPTKRWEDLRLRRPTGVWGWLAQHAPHNEFSSFVTAVQALPEEPPLEEWLATHRGTLQDLAVAAKRHLQEAHAEIERAGLPSAVLYRVSALEERVVSSYG